MPRSFIGRRLGPEERKNLPGSFVRLSRGYVHYELSGPEDGPAAVLVPGLSVPYSTWDRNAPAFAAAGFRTLRYEHYGRGYSDRPRGSYDLDYHVDQLVELVEALDLRRPLALVGLSMGGPVAAAAAVKRPGFSSAVVLVDPLFEWPRPDFSGRLLSAPLAGDFLMALRGRAILSKGQRGDFLEASSYEEFLPSYLPAFEYRGIPSSVLAATRSISSWPLGRTFEALGGAGIPILLFWGRGDSTLPFEQSARLLALLPGASFHPVAGAGHVPQWEKSSEFNEAALSFLGRI